MLTLCVLYALISFILLYTLFVYLTRQVIDLNGDPYLIRYFVFKSYFLEDKLGWNVGRIYLHNIIRSDHDRALHDHPWNFRTFLLWGGYREWADFRQIGAREREKSALERSCHDTTKQWNIPSMIDSFPNVYRDFKAPCTLRRGAGWRHRLELEKPAWTLVFVSGKQRTWGFWQGLGRTYEKFCPWKKYDTQLGICED